MISGEEDLTDPCYCGRIGTHLRTDNCLLKDGDSRLEELRRLKMFETKDSGKRQEFSTGMRRDVQEGKPRYDLVDWSMIKRWAELMERGAKKYGEHNWKKAATREEAARFRASALRHCIQWFLDETDEDHGAAVYFNISGYEMVKEKLKCPPSL